MANNVNVSLILRTKGFVKGLAESQRQLTVFGRTAQTVGRTLQYALGGALIAVSADALKAAADFDLANAKLKALAGPENAGGVLKLAETARELGKNSVFTAAEVASLQLELKKLGLTVDEVDGLSESVVKFATAMDVDAATAGATLVKTINKFGKTFDQYSTKAEAAESLTEQFAAGVLNSALTFETFGSALNYVGGEANAAGFTFAETSAILAKLTDAGFEGSRAGTILRRIFINLAKDGVVDLNKGFEDLIENQQEFAQVVDIAGARSAGGLASIQGLKGVIAELTTTIENSRGGVDQLFEAVDQSLIGRLKNLRSALQEIGIIIIEKFGDGLKDSISRFSEWLRGIDEGDVKAAKFVITLRIVSGLLSGFTNIAKLAASAIVKFGRASAALNPAGAIIVGIVAGFAIASDAIRDYNKELRKSQDGQDNLQTDFLRLVADDQFGKDAKGRNFKDLDSFNEYKKAAQEEVTAAIIAGQNALTSVPAALVTSKQREAFTEAVYDGFGRQDFRDLLNKNIAEKNVFGYDEETINKRRDAAISYYNSLYAIKQLQEKLTAIGNASIADVGASLLPKAGSGDVVKLKSVIDDFEAIYGTEEAFGKIAGNTESKLSAVATRLEFLNSLANGYKLEQLEIEATGRSISDNLQEQIDDNDLLVDYYSTQQKYLQGVLKEEKKIQKELDKRFNISEFLRDQRSEEAKDTQNLLEKYNKLSAPLKDVVDEGALVGEAFGDMVDAVDKLDESLIPVYDKLRNLGLGVAESINLSKVAMTELFNVLEGLAEKLGNIIGEALVDPTVSLGEALKDAGRQFLILAASWVAKVILLTGLIALGNALTGGALGAFLKTQAAAGNLSGSASIAGGLASGNGVGSLFRAEGVVSGNNLVIATRRGVTANDRIYG